MRAREKVHFVVRVRTRANSDRNVPGTVLELFRAEEGFLSRIVATRCSCQCRPLHRECTHRVRAVPVTNVARATMMIIVRFKRVGIAVGNGRNESATEWSLEAVRFRVGREIRNEITDAGSYGRPYIETIEAEDHPMHFSALWRKTHSYTLYVTKMHNNAICALIAMCSFVSVVKFKFSKIDFK